jgi:hypothetical protein
VRLLAGEQPAAQLLPGTERTPVQAQELQQRRGQQGIAVLLALALLDRITPRSLSMSPTFSRTTSEARKPAP